MIFWNQAKDDDLIYVAFYKTKAYQHLIHNPLKLCKGVLQTKWKKLPLIQIIPPMRIYPPKCEMLPSLNNN